MRVRLFLGRVFVSYCKRRKKSGKYYITANSIEANSLSSVSAKKKEGEREPDGEISGEACGEIEVGEEEDGDGVFWADKDEVCQGEEEEEEMDIDIPLSFSPEVLFCREKSKEDNKRNCLVLWI